MKFADKLISLRKKEGWSQEDLANKMNVARQSVSKWEGGQSIPDLEKIVFLSNLFGVTTDYLLKDEIDSVESYEINNKESLKKPLTIDEVNNFLIIKNKTSKTIGFAALLCILSPIVLFILIALNESMPNFLSEDIAAGIGFIVLLFFVIIAAIIFILSGNKTSPFDYISKGNFSINESIVSLIKKRKEEYSNTHKYLLIAGTILFIFSLVPIFVGAMVDSNNIILMATMLSLMFFFAGLGSICFIRTGIVWASFEKLLK